MLICFSKLRKKKYFSSLKHNQLHILDLIGFDLMNPRAAEASNTWKSSPAVPQLKFKHKTQTKKQGVQDLHPVFVVPGWREAISSQIMVSVLFSAHMFFWFVLSSLTVSMKIKAEHEAQG